MPTHRNASSEEKSNAQLAIDRIMLSEQIALLQEELVKHEEQAKQSQDLTMQIMALAEEKTELQSAVEALKEQKEQTIKDLTKSKDALEHRVSQLTQEANLLQSQIVTLKEMESSVSLNRQVKEVELDNFKKEFDQLLALQVQIKNTVAAQNAEAARLNQLEENAKSRLATLEALVLKEQDKLLSLTQEKEHLETQSHELAKKLQATQAGYEAESKAYLAEVQRRQEERAEFESWKAGVEAGLTEKAAQLAEKESDLNLRDEWIDGKINTVRKYKANLEKSIGKRLENLII